MIFLLNYLSILDSSGIQEFLGFLDFSDLVCNFSIIVYSNMETDKSEILSENKGLAGVYKIAHVESDKLYIGSAADLSKRLMTYYSLSHLKRADSHITRALLKYGHSAFSLTILEFIPIKDLSKEEARKLILSFEQKYIDSLEPEYNILKVAGSSLGQIHTTESKTKISEALTGKFHSIESRALMSEAKAGDSNPFFGKTHSPEALAKMSVANSGKNHPLFGVTGVNHPMFGKTHSIETIKKMSEARKGIIKTESHKAKISRSMCKKVFVYSSATPTILYKEFMSISEAANHFSCNIMTISKYVKSGKLFQNKYFLYSSNK